MAGKPPDWSARLTKIAGECEARLERAVLHAGLTVVALVAEFVVARRLRRNHQR